MTVDPTNAGASNIFERAKNILLQPQAEWDRIAGEPADIQKIYMGYVLPLAALAAICSFIGLSIIGVSAFGVTVRVPILSGLIGAVVQVIVATAGVYVMALIINALAPNFGSQQDIGQAHKISAYGSTPSFVASVFSILPPLAPLAILGLYSLVLMYVGLPRLMKTPEDKRIGYLATVIIIAIVLAIVVGAVTSTVRTAFGGVAFPGVTIGK